MRYVDPEWQFSGSLVWFAVYPRTINLLAWCYRFEIFTWVNVLLDLDELYVYSSALFDSSQQVCRTTCVRSTNLMRSRYDDSKVVIVGCKVTGLHKRIPGLRNALALLYVEWFLHGKPQFHEPGKVETILLWFLVPVDSELMEAVGSARSRVICWSHVHSLIMSVHHYAISCFLSQRGLHVDCCCCFIFRQGEKIDFYCFTGLLRHVIVRTYPKLPSGYATLRFFFQGLLAGEGTDKLSNVALDGKSGRSSTTNPPPSRM